MTALGTLYGVGVGPGDPDLLTLKAVKALRASDVIFAASSTKNEASLALSIAAPHLGPDAETVRLGFPMTRDKDALAAAWRANADAVYARLARGLNAAFLTLGDPLTYSTFGYLLRTLSDRLADVPVEIIPGVTSYQAAAARTRRVLVEGRESFAVLSGTASEDALAVSLAAADSAVILKAYKNMPAIRRAIERARLTDAATFVTRLGQEGEAVLANLDAVPDRPSYFSLILIRKNGRPGRT